MRKLIVFNSISIDGFFADRNNDVRWAHSAEGDEAFNKFVEGNAQGGGVLLFGRKTYDLMASFWPTPQAKKAFPLVAEGMNKSQKIVFSRSLDKSPWNNTTVMKGDLVEEVRKLKNSPGPGICILGSGSLVAQLTEARLIDEYQIMMIPVVLGTGRSMFDGVKEKITLKLIQSRSFKNGNVFSSYGAG